MKSGRGRFRRGPGFHISRAFGGARVSHFTRLRENGGFTFHGPSEVEGPGFHISRSGRGFTFHGLQGRPGFHISRSPQGPIPGDENPDRGILQQLPVHAGPHLQLLRMLNCSWLQTKHLACYTGADGMSTNQDILTEGKHMHVVMFVTNHNTNSHAGPICDALASVSEPKQVTIVLIQQQKEDKRSG